MEPGRILIVDDDRDIRELIALVLEHEGYRVSAAANGQEGLAHLHRFGPHCLILLDLMMPLMNGYAFRAAQRADPVFSSVPVVLLSGAGQLDEHNVALETAGVLQKPVALAALLEVVGRYCRPAIRPAT